MKFGNQKEKFAQRLFLEWLPTFCDSRAEDFNIKGFKDKSLERLSDFDAYWFMKAVDTGMIAEKDGFFTSPKSSAKEQILFGGLKGQEIRDIFLWAEPVITLGAVARLVEEFHWPIELIGAQSKYPWPFDLVCYAANSDDYLVACEVKKSKSEIVKLMADMNVFASSDPCQNEPQNAVKKNAFRKVVGIRESWPTLFWALGPDNFGKVYKIEKEVGSDLFKMNELPDQSCLACWL